MVFSCNPSTFIVGYPYHPCFVTMKSSEAAAGSSRTMETCLLPRPKKLLLVLVALALLWVALLAYLSAQGHARHEYELMLEVSELRGNNVQLRGVQSERARDLAVLARLLAPYIAPHRPRGVPMPDWNSLSSDTRGLLLQASGLSALPLGGKNSTLQMSLPSIYDIMPHLRKHSGSLSPAFRIARNPRSGVSMVLGVPTVRRDKQSYLLTSLHSFLSNMSPQEENDTLLVVLIAEIDLSYVEKIAKQITTAFPRQVASGLVEIISPPASFYPDWSSMAATLGDDHERFKWRSKEIIDYVFIMMYVQARGRYFAQLEDDIVTKPGFVSSMRDFADQRNKDHKPWFVIEFTELGSIGKMFRSSDLPFVINYYCMFYTNQPVDWLLPRIIATKLCSLDISGDGCKQLERTLWIRYKPSLFQHIGKESSLKGKIQDLKDSSFGVVPLFTPHRNPAVSSVSTSMTERDLHTLDRAYHGKDFLWTKGARAGDIVKFNFSPPANITRFLFRSGNVEQPLELFSNTTVEALPYRNVDQVEAFIVIGEFDILGEAKGTVGKALRPVKSLQLRVHSQLENGVMLSEIFLETEERNF